jgi:hypothetical protein
MLLGCAMHVLEALDLPLLRRCVFDPQLQHWQFSWRYGVSQAAGHLARALCGYSAIFNAGDNAAFDLTPHSAAVWNSAVATHADTYYFSLAGSLSSTASATATAASASTAATATAASDAPIDNTTTSSSFNSSNCDAASQQQQQRTEERSTLRTAVDGMYAVMSRGHSRRAAQHAAAVQKAFGLDAALWHSAGHDGIVETWAQRHPVCPTAGPHANVQGFPDEHSTVVPQQQQQQQQQQPQQRSQQQQLQPGVWYCQEVAGGDHLWARVSDEQAAVLFSRLADLLVRCSGTAPANNGSNRSSSASSSIVEEPTAGADTVLAAATVRSSSSASSTVTKTLPAAEVVQRRVTVKLLLLWLAAAAVVLLVLTRICSAATTATTPAASTAVAAVLSLDGRWTTAAGAASVLLWRAAAAAVKRSSSSSSASDSNNTSLLQAADATSACSVVSPVAACEHVVRRG